MGRASPTPRAVEVPSILHRAASVVGIEASAEHITGSRVFVRLGHTVRSMSSFVKPYRKLQKNEAYAESICEAMTLPDIRFVLLKSVDRQELQCLHRVRSRARVVPFSLSPRSAVCRLECGIIFATTSRKGASRLANCSRTSSRCLTETCFTAPMKSCRKLLMRKPSMVLIAHKEPM